MAEIARPADWVKRVQIDGDKVTVNGKPANPDESAQAKEQLGKEHDTQRRIKEAR
jgi:hypothetical protein